ncbi:MAG: hypothetical protein P9L90_03535 [Candidatus Aadella gelida]|nr:hypothetical protein [Candidatus Aadella gelida]
MMPISMLPPENPNNVYHCTVKIYMIGKVNGSSPTVNMHKTVVPLLIYR